MTSQDGNEIPLYYCFYEGVVGVDEKDDVKQAAVSVPKKVPLKPQLSPSASSSASSNHDVGMSFIDLSSEQITGNNTGVERTAWRIVGNVTILPKKAEKVDGATSAIVDGGENQTGEAAGRKGARRYFEPPDTSVSCYNCGEPGHRSGECMNEKKQLPCYLCGQVGHRRNECPHELCFFCNKSGHQVKACPKKRVTCPKCNRVGHTQAECPCDTEGNRADLIDNEYPPELITRVRCISCTRNGHLDCTPPRPELRICCFICGEDGHFGDDCRSRRLHRFSRPIGCFGARHSGLAGPSDLTGYCDLDAAPKSSTHDRHSRHHHRYYSDDDDADADMANKSQVSQDRNQRWRPEKHRRHYKDDDDHDDRHEDERRWRPEKHRRSVEEYGKEGSGQKRQYHGTEYEPAKRQQHSRSRYEDDDKDDDQDDYRRGRNQDRDRRGQRHVVSTHPRDQKPSRFNSRRDLEIDDEDQDKSRDAELDDRKYKPHVAHQDRLANGKEATHGHRHGHSLRGAPSPGQSGRAYGSGDRARVKSHIMNGRHAGGPGQTRAGNEDLSKVVQNLFRKEGRENQDHRRRHR